SAAKSATASRDSISSGRVWRRGSSTCTRAPTQIVARDTINRTGTARRNSGSAVRDLRYAGLGIDCPKPLIESAWPDALATSARAIEGLRSEFPPVTLETEGCAASLPESLVDWNRWTLICRESDESIV